MSIFKHFIFTLCFVAWLSASAEIPTGYYDSCKGKSGQELLKALYSTIGSHTNVGYSGLWDVYKQSDVRADGTLWDIYTTKHWPANFTRCGNYKVVGDCVNREHSMPKSWWGGAEADQYSDAFHLYPTDGRVNGQRSNFPYGECAGGTRLPANGSVQALGKLGACTFTGFSGTVFEPDDEYKGDLARSYFYMAACYNNAISGWTKGNGADMLAGNSYPVYKTWAVNLLLKWARQDEVSQKELDRNEAIYSFQHNRNPFIDYPELIEYVWGNKVGQAWYPGGSTDPQFDLPVPDVTINFGKAAVGIQRSKAITVKGRNLTADVSVAVTGGFTVSPASLSAAEVNAGTSVTLAIQSATAGDSEGVLTLKSGTAERSIDIIAEIVDGLPVTISDVTPEGFTVNWVNISSDPAARYGLDIRQGNASVAGYPTGVLASAETHTATGLDAATDYTVTFTGLPAGVASPQINARTADPVPSIDLLFDGTLHFDTEPGTPSDIAELLVDADNIDGDITVTVEKPFEISTDKSAWSQSLTLVPEEDRFYMRVNSSVAGNFETSVTLSAGTYVNDEPTASATVKSTAAFLEDWEIENPTKVLNAYSNKTFSGNACSWTVSNAGFGTDSGDTSFNGSTVLRFGNNSNSSLSMAEDKAKGLGTVTFDAAKWGNDASATVKVEYSADGGSTWNPAGSITLSSSTPASYTITVNKGGNGRIRFVQTAGKRWLLDNIGISDYSATGAVTELDYHEWDAFSRDGRLIIESRDTDRTYFIYSIDGLALFRGRIAGDEQAVSLPAGLYIVTDGSFARRVVVK